MGLSTTVSIPLIGRHWECYSNMPTYMILPSLLNCLSSFPWLICFAAIRKNALILGFLFVQYDSLLWKSLGLSFILFSRLLCFSAEKEILHCSFCSLSIGHWPPYLISDYKIPDGWTWNTNYMEKKGCGGRKDVQTKVPNALISGNNVSVIPAPITLLNPLEDKTILA